MVQINKINISNSNLVINYESAHQTYKCDTSDHICKISTDSDAVDLVTCNHNCTKPVPTTSILGAWSETIGCGDDLFDVISLSSALPGDYVDGSYDKFFSNGLVGNIRGWYDDIYNNGKTYFISIGGLYATESGWNTFLTTLSDDTKLQNFINACSCRNITGIDWDIENFNDSLTEKLKNISIKLKNKNFKIMLTILLGQPQWFKSLFSTKDDSYYDYVTLMLYNGGMYVASGSGGGCDWDTWAELFLTNGTGGCSTPQGETREQYIAASNIQNINANKIVLGLRNDNSPANHNPSTLEMFKTAQGLVNTYNAAGIFFWVLQTDLPFTNMNEILTYLGKPTIDNCAIDWNSCNPVTKPCKKGGPSCVASYCAKIKQTLTDNDCSVCIANPSQWPCNATGFCEETLRYPPTQCTSYA
jgi:hypothetical protein